MVVKDNKDVEMKDASSVDVTKSEEVKKEEEKKDPELLTLEDIKEHVRHIEKAVSTKEPRFMSRVIRALVTVRRKLNPRILRSLMKGYFIAPNVINKEELLPFLAD
ncbi:hypothetical protein EGW08_000750, partial [Elysia chlorotica]